MQGTANDEKLPEHAKIEAVTMELPDLAHVFRVRTRSCRRRSSYELASNERAEFVPYAEKLTLTQ